MEGKMKHEGKYDQLVLFILTVIVLLIVGKLLGWF